MATKRKPAKKSTKAKKTARKKAKPAKRPVKKLKSSRKKSAQKKAAAKTKRPAKKAISGGKKASSIAKPTGRQRPARPAAPFSRDLQGPDSAGQSGDLQGLSNRERADSESVDELLEEGNAFEAGVVSGVEEADENEVSEVHTHEVPEDDVPGEYLDED
jgi:hypothetical protein